MASNQPIKAIDVVPSDTINIPEPGSYATGTNAQIGAGTSIIDLTANFQGVSNPGNTGFSNKVAVGDVVYVTDAAGVITARTVTAVVSNTQLTVSGIVSGNPGTYAIYKSNGGAQTQPVAGHEGYSLYVGGTGSGNLSVVPASSTDTVVLKGVSAGAFIPLQVTRVNSTGTDVTDILALE
tara:strand:+ start:379 stop:918 length:540 start_codon:yes stop_codon:yes gene_type:complete